MHCAQLIFSPTGGTARVARVLSGTWETEVETIDLTDPGVAPRGFGPEDLVLIAVPSYGGRVPALAAERLAGMEGNGARCALCCVYGNRAYEDTLAELQDLAQARGFRVFAAVAAIAEHSIAHRYAAGRPDGRDVETLEKFARAIWEKFRAGPGEEPPAIPGNRPYKKWGGGGMVPQAGSNCVRCGMCAAQCPAQAISREDPTVTDGKTCISCMRCVARCPQGARKVDEEKLAGLEQALEKLCADRKENELYI